MERDGSSATSEVCVLNSPPMISGLILRLTAPSSFFTKLSFRKVYKIQSSMLNLKALFARTRPFLSTNARNFTPMPEKSSESRYSAISSDDDSQTSEHDDLLPQYSSKSSRRSGISPRSKLLITAGSLFVLASYSALCVGLTTLYWKGERVHGANVVDTPLRKHMIYEPTNMHIGESTADYTLMAHASDEVDQAWADLLQDFFTEVPYSYVEKVGRLDTSVKTENGFVATYTFMHQLHCLVSKPPSLQGPRNGRS